MAKYIKPPERPVGKWRKGPPPSIGWWPASVSNDPQCLRWWDGKNWSDGAYPHMDAETAALAAQSIDRRMRSIRWCDPWWPTQQQRQDGGESV